MGALTACGEVLLSLERSAGSNAENDPQAGNMGSRSGPSARPGSLRVTAFPAPRV